MQFFKIMNSFSSPINRMLNYIILFVIYANLTCCDKRNKIPNNPIIYNEASEGKRASEDHVLKQAKIFLHLIRGSEACEFYNDPKRPPDISFSNKDMVWNVFFNYPAGGFTIKLNEDASKANYYFMNGMIIKKLDEKMHNDNFPLYTIDEMVDLLGLPRNNLSPPPSDLPDHE